MQTLYLSSMESLAFDGVYECTILKKLYFDTGKIAALVKLNPSIDCQYIGFQEPIEYLVLTNRHAGRNIFAISEFPYFVHIAIPKAENPEALTTISTESLHHVAWGELYRTAEDAAEHRFD